MSAHDFDWPAIMNHFHALFSWQEMVNAQWQVGFRTTHGVLSSVRFRQMRQALSRQLSDTRLLVSQSNTPEGYYKGRVSRPICYSPTVESISSKFNRASLSQHAQFSGYTPARTQRRKLDHGQSRRHLTRPCFTGLEWM